MLKLGSELLGRCSMKEVIMDGIMVVVISVSVSISIFWVVDKLNTATLNATNEIVNRCSKTEVSNNGHIKR